MHTRSSRSGVRRILWILAAVAMIVAVMPLAGAAADGPITLDLIADGRADAPDVPVDVGDVTVSDDGTTLFINFKIVDSDGSAWCITKTQVDVAEVYEGLEQTKKGLAIPGKFAFSEIHDPCEDADGGVAYEINMVDAGIDVMDDFAVAVHADVTDMNDIVGYEQEFDLEAFEAALPATTVGIRAINYPNANAYFDISLTGGSGVLPDGTYPTWCIDETHTIYLGTNYTADVYSSYEELPPSVTEGDDPHVDMPENLDLVNWVINNSGAYTSGQVQNVIWNLIDDNPPALNATEQVLYDAAFANGEGFVPSCGDVIAVILVPITPGDPQVVIGQVLAAQVGISCDPIYRGETAWGGVWVDGAFMEEFDGKGWAGYFSYPMPLGYMP